MVMVHIYDVDKIMEKLTKFMEKINKLSLPATILIASIVLGGFYYAIETNKLKYNEKQQQIKLVEEKTKQDQVKQEQNKNKLALDNCLADADTNYSNNWYRECKSEGKLTDKCISLHDMTFNEYAKQNNIPNATENFEKNFAAMKDFLKQKDDCSCRLAQYNADSINKTLQDDKAECFKKYPQ